MSVEFVQILFSISCFAIFKNFSAFDNQFSVQKYFFFLALFVPFLFLRRATSYSDVFCFGRLNSAVCL